MDLSLYTSVCGAVVVVVVVVVVGESSFHDQVRDTRGARGLLHTPLSRPAPQNMRSRHRSVSPIGSCSSDGAWGSGDSFSPSPTNRHNCYGNGITFSMEEVRHSAEGGDPWVVINKGVYTIGALLATHPGGAEALRGAAGTDATATFISQGHSQAAIAALESHFLGALADEEECNGKGGPQGMLTGGTQSLCALAVVLGVATSVVYMA